MKRYGLGKLSKFTVVICAVALMLAPLTVNAQESSNSDSVAQGTVSTPINSNGNNVTGTGAQAGNGDRNTALGIGALIVNSSNNTISANGAFAGNGSDNTAVGIGAVVIGTPNPGIDTNQSFTSGQTLVIGSGASANNSTGAKVVGYGAQAGNGNYNTAIGSGAAAGNSDSNTAVGANAQALAGNSIALGANSIANRSNTVSVGSPGSERQITNVAPGVYGTDAVNVDQLNSLASRTDRLGAMAFAFSALAPMAYDPNEPTQYSAGIGTYNGQSAISLGFFHYTRPDVMINGGVAMALATGSGWEKAARFGITWKTGHKQQADEKFKPIVVTNDQAATPSTPSTNNDNILDRVNRIIASTND